MKHTSAENRLPRNTTSPRDLEATRLYESALLTEQGLDRPWVSADDGLGSMSSRRCNAFIETSASLQPFRAFIQRWQIVERSIVVASETLGAPTESTLESHSVWSDAHYNLVLEMLWMWLLDETLDHAPTLALASRPLLARISSEIARSSDGESSIPGSTEPLHEQLVPLWDAISCVLVEYTRLEVRPRGEVFCSYMDRYLLGYMDVHQHHSWTEYLTHRTFNGGCWATVMHAATCFAWGTSDVLDEVQGACSELIERHTVVGGIANDLLGLEKDLDEGVVSACAVYKTTFDLPDEVAAIPHLVRWCNDRLDELLDAYRASEREADRLVLFAALRAVSAYTGLYKSFQPMYRGRLLRSSLRALAASGHSVEYVGQPA